MMFARYMKLQIILNRFHKKIYLTHCISTVRVSHIFDIVSKYDNMTDQKMLRKISLISSINFFFSLTIFINCSATHYSQTNIINNCHIIFFLLPKLFGILNRLRFFKIVNQKMNSSSVMKLLRKCQQALNFHRYSSIKTALQCDVAIVGGNLGAILANQLYYVLDSNKKIMLIHQNSNMELATHRPLYEQGKLQYEDISLNVKSYIDSMIKCNKSSVKSFQPEQSRMTLKNGQIVCYKNLVIATGLHKNLSSIQGLQAALIDPNQSVYTSLNTFVDKKSKGCTEYNYIDGDTIFYIPPSPNSSIQNFNMFIFYNAWQKALAKSGRKFDFSLINANENLCSTSWQADDWLKGSLQTVGVDIISRLKMLKIFPKKNRAVFVDLETNKKITKDFSKLYTILPCDTHPSLQAAGLIAANGLLDVDKQSLKHNKYDNIFGLGQVNNIPTSRSLYAGLSQIKTVRNNIEKCLNGHNRQIRYNGYTSTPIIMPSYAVNWLSYRYDGKLNVNTQSMDQFLRQKEQILKIYKMNLWRNERIIKEESLMTNRKMRISQNIN